jgi:integrase
MNDAVMSPQSENTVRSRYRRLSPGSRGFAEYCSRLDAQKSTTISQAATAWLDHLQTRRRRPIKMSSAKTFESYVSRWITPLLGHLEVCDLGVIILRDFIRQLDEAGLSAKMQNELASCVKAIVASIVNEEGEPRYNPRVWSNERLDLPMVERAKQKTPTVTREQIERAISKSSENYQCLYACLAGSGLRINEALAIRLDDPNGPHTVFDPASSTIHVRRGLWRGREQDSPKTRAAIRSVEVPHMLGKMLAEFANNRNGWLFSNSRGNPLDVSVARAHFDEVFGKGIGFHSLRRFRITHLAEQNCPPAIARYWIGHATSDIHERYNHLSENVALRRAEAQRCGIGFTLSRQP